MTEENKYTKSKENMERENTTLGFSKKDFLKTGESLMFNKLMKAMILENKHDIKDIKPGLH